MAGPEGGLSPGCWGIVANLTHFQYCTRWPLSVEEVFRLPSTSPTKQCPRVSRTDLALEACCWTVRVNPVAVDIFWWQNVAGSVVWAERPWRREITTGYRRLPQLLHERYHRWERCLLRALQRHWWTRYVCVLYLQDRQRECYWCVKSKAAQ